MKNLLLVVLLVLQLSCYSQTSYKEDFNYFWQTVNDNYCYFDKKQVDWKKVKEIYSPQADTISSRVSFISLLENCIYELYDHHCSLRTRNKLSRRLVPTGADIWAEFDDSSKAIIKEVRKGSDAERSGLVAGMQVTAVDGTAIDIAILPFLSHTINKESKSFALRLVLAGNHVNARKITVMDQQLNKKDFYPDLEGLWLEDVHYAARVESALYGETGYLRVNNYLFDTNLISDFDSVLNTLLDKKALIIDFRETPSGGNTTVARAILGRFINEDHFFLKHELVSEEKQTTIKRSWMEIVSPRKVQYKGKLVIIADHWTGSVGEAIVVAFHGMKRATIIGTPMAQLNGAIESFELPTTKIGVNISTEALYHINGTPREDFKPDMDINVISQSTNNDVILNAALSYLKKQGVAVK